MLSFHRLWSNHPGPKIFPCDKSTFINQCAIRLGVALQGAGVSLISFPGTRCYPGFKHNPKHILRAQELADWLASNSNIAGAIVKYRKGEVSSKNFSEKRGIVFIQNGWGLTDHIDLWNGIEMKAGEDYYFDLGAVWFWHLS